MDASESGSSKWSPSKELGLDEILKILDSPTSSPTATPSSASSSSTASSSGVLLHNKDPLLTDDPSPYFDHTEASLFGQDRQPSQHDLVLNQLRIKKKKKKIWKEAKEVVDQFRGRSGSLWDVEVGTKKGAKDKGLGTALESKSKSKSLPSLPTSSGGRKKAFSLPKADGVPVPLPTPARRPPPTAVQPPFQAPISTDLLAQMVLQVHKDASAKSALRLSPTPTELTMQNAWHEVYMPASPSRLQQFYHPMTGTFQVGERGFKKVETVARVVERPQLVKLQRGSTEYLVRLVGEDGKEIRVLTNEQMWIKCEGAARPAKNNAFLVGQRYHIYGELIKWKNCPVTIQLHRRFALTFHDEAMWERVQNYAALYHGLNIHKKIRLSYTYGVDLYELGLENMIVIDSEAAKMWKQQKAFVSKIDDMLDQAWVDNKSLLEAVQSEPVLVDDDVLLSKWDPPVSALSASPIVPVSNTSSATTTTAPTSVSADLGTPSPPTITVTGISDFLASSSSARVAETTPTTTTTTTPTPTSGAAFQPVAAFVELSDTGTSSASSTASSDASSEAITASSVASALLLLSGEQPSAPAQKTTPSPIPFTSFPKPDAPVPFKKRKTFQRQKSVPPPPFSLDEDEEDDSPPL